MYNTRECQAITEQRVSAWTINATLRKEQSVARTETENYYTYTTYIVLKKSDRLLYCAQKISYLQITI